MSTSEQPARTLTRAPRKHEQPIASESNRARLVSIYMHCDGLSLAEANAKFKRENRKAWARACA